MEKAVIDINCDVGEGVGNEHQLFPLISSCNIACGGHTGDETSMLRSIQLAKQHKVLIGAHPSYPDRANFGRTSISITADDLKKSLQAQLTNFSHILDGQGGTLHHIKPHGALYNDLAKKKALVLVFLDAVKAYKEVCSLYAPYGSIYAQEAIAQGFRVVYEAFADRNYNVDLSLVSRKMENALIQDPQEVLDHVLSMVKKKKVKTTGGKFVKIVANTYCFHGDTPNALQILMYLSKNMPKHQISINK